MKSILWILSMITLLICILNNDKRYMKVALKSKLLGVAR